MKNTFGQSVCVTLFGESHGAAVGAVIDGIAPGISVDESFIADMLSKRRGEPEISTGRRETDEFRIISGVYNGYTTGTPLCIIIDNADTNSSSYDSEIARPGHADYTAEQKYRGFQDGRGGGHFSGRITAAMTAAGAILYMALKNIGIRIGTHIKSIGNVCDRDFDMQDAEKDIDSLEKKMFAVLDEKAAERMKKTILAAKEDGDSVGGVLETVITGLPSGLGEPWFDTAESVISHILFSVPAVKGVEFGDGFALCNMRGSEANDALRCDNGRFYTLTNRNGGINGGITNGMPVVFRCAVKPTPSIYLQQETVNLKTGENIRLNIKGRHDPAIVHRARIVADCAASIAVCDLIAQRYGTDALYRGIR